MQAPIAEDLLLNHALQEGLLSAGDLAAAAATAAAKSDLTPPRWGPRLDVLIERGCLSEETVRRLVAALAIADGRRDPEPLGLAKTLDSTSDGLAFPPVVSVSAFPVPNWDKYEFLGLLGRGGMGAVYKARDRRLGRVLALKFIHGEDPGQIQRFMQEARAQARLEHPKICQVYEVGTVEKKPYIAMQYVDGLPLDQASRTMSLLDKVRVMKDAAQALHAAHEQGIIHRDIKPSNIMIRRIAAPDGTTHPSPVIMDFGLARDSAVKGLTESGAVMGTPAYMSPEQARGDVRRLDRRTDVYSLGATLYALLAGRPPFEDETVVNIILKVMSEPPPPLRSQAPLLPEALELITSKCLNKEVDQRYLTAQALADDLERFLSSQRVTARRLGYGYRVHYWARRNRALAAVALALLVSVVLGSGYAIRSYFVTQERAALAKKEAELAQRLGQSVKDLEWLVRTAYLLPLHDTSYEKGLVRERMAEITSELRSAGEIGVRLGAYVLGRGHLALHEWDKAYEQLSHAEHLGYRDPELDYALGRVLGEKYSRAVEEARKSGDKSYFEKRRQELEQEYLVPGRAYLQKSRRLKTVSPSLVEALIDFYDHRYDAALLNAYMARRQHPWLYETLKLEGDVYMARALEQKDRGDPDQAERNLADAIAHYEKAAAIGHSDHQIYEMIAEAWIRREEIDMYQGRDPTMNMERALFAADQALEAEPKESYGYTKKAFSCNFAARYAQLHGNSPMAIELFQKQNVFGRQAVELHPDDAFAHEITGISYARIASLSSDQQKPIQKYLDDSYEHFEAALRINPGFVWAYNDYGVALGVAAEYKIARNENPEVILNKKIQLIKRAIQLDDKYVIGFVALSSAYLALIRWRTEHGQDIQEFVEAAEHAISSALKINSKFLLAYGNLASLYVVQASQDLDRGQDIRPVIELSIQNNINMIKSNKNFLQPYSSLAFAYYLASRNALNAHQDPSPDVAKGLAAIAECYRIKASHPECQSYEAQLRALATEWERQQGRPFLAALEQARKLAAQACAQAPDNYDLQVILAEICFQQAAALWDGGKRPAALLDEGLAALDRALKLSSGRPRALALRGALLVLQSRMLAGPQRQGSLQQGQESLGLAFAGNPLLRRRFAPWVEEAERLARQP